MEVGRIASELKYVEVNGCTLSIEERQRLELGQEQLLKTLDDLKISLFFWGKIRGK